MPFGYTFGTGACQDGYEGVPAKLSGFFVTCHLQIYVPTFLEKNAILFIAVGVSVGAAVPVIIFFIRRRIRQQQLNVKKERRIKNRASSSRSMRTDDSVSSLRMPSSESVSGEEPVTGTRARLRERLSYEPSGADE
jgi:hypothetical protein